MSDEHPFLPIELARLDARIARRRQAHARRREARVRPAAGAEWAEAMAAADRHDAAADPDDAETWLAAMVWLAVLELDERGGGEIELAALRAHLAFQLMKIDDANLTSRIHLLALTDDDLVAVVEQVRVHLDGLDDAAA